MENPLASTICIYSFSAHYAVKSMKSIPTVNPAIMENKEWLIVKAHTPVIDIKVGVSMYRFTSSSLNVRLTFQANIT